MRGYRTLTACVLGLGVLVAVTAGALGVRGTRGDRPPVYFFPDMKFQPRYHAQGRSPYFADGRASRGDRGGVATPARPTDRRVAFAGADYYTDAGLLVAADPRFLAADVGYFRGLASLDEKDEPGTGRKVPDFLPRLPVGAFLQYDNAVLTPADRERVKKLPQAERDYQVRAALVRRGRERYNATCAACHGATGGKWGEPTANGITTQYGMSGVANYHQNRLREAADGDLYNTVTHGKNTMMGYGHMLKVEDRWAVVAYVRALQRAMLGTEAEVPEGARAGLK